MALELAVISVVAGAVLGLRYKVLILVPAVMFVMIFAAIVGVARADSLWSIVLMMAALSIAVQIGYVAGIVLRAVVEWVSTSFRGRGPELSCSVGPVWLHNWQLNGLPVPPGAIARIRRPPPPQV